MSRAKRNRYCFRTLALIALLFNVAYPSGYMPGDISQGQWIVVCPYGLPDGMLADSGHDHGGDEGERAEDSSSPCVIGGQQAGKFALPLSLAVVPVLPGSLPSISISLASGSYSGAIYQSRAPPVSQPA